MAKASRTPPLKRFRKRVEFHIENVEDSVGFPSDEEWAAHVLAKIQELSNSPVNMDQLALLGALIEVWGTDRGIDE